MDRVEEQITVENQVITTGLVTLRKTVEHAEELVRLQQVETSYEVERVAVGQVLEHAPPARRELPDGTIVYAVVREVPVIVTRYEFVEELYVRPRRVVHESEHAMPVRRERIDVDRRRAPQG